MNNNKSAAAIESVRHTSISQNLQFLAEDLNDVCSRLEELCTHLTGGGIVQARDIELSVCSAMPKLRRAVATLNAAAMMDKELSDSENYFARLAEVTAPSQNPLLM